MVPAEVSEQTEAVADAIHQRTRTPGAAEKTGGK